jgi:hypothetical protein
VTLSTVFFGALPIALDCSGVQPTSAIEKIKMLVL